MKYLILLFAIGLMSCDNDGQINESPKYITIKGSYVRPYMIGACEYFIYDRSLCHKGDCKNPIHKCKCLENNK